MEQGTMDKRYRPLLLLTYVREGDVNGVGWFIATHPESIRFQFPPGLGTALHLAANLGKTEIVEEMMESADEDVLAIQDATGFTALHFAASCGHRRIAELMVAKNPKLVTMLNNKKTIPLREACGNNHKQLATFLYRATPFRWLCKENGGKYGADILKCCILGQMFDIVLDMVMRRPKMLVTMDANGWNAAIQLASMPTAFPSGGKVPFRLRWVYSLIRVMTASSEDRSMAGQNWCHRLLMFVLNVTGTQHIYDLKRAQVCSLELLDRTCRHIYWLDFEKLESAGVYEAFHKAIKNGIVEFVKRAVKTRSSLLNKYVDEKGRNMFMLAVEFRQEKIFNLMYPLSDRASWVSLVDKEKNTLLHMAGMLSPSAKLSDISGAALRMQRELQWFQEVERVINPMYKDNTNSDNETARQIFTRTHKDLAAAGEKWMKETASSSTVVAALIVTIMFTAAFTVPGGNNQETGIPILLHYRSFQTFMVADAISLFAASNSVLMFLGILTSRYAEADFLRSLPTKLVIGLSSLFVSIAAMMVAFCATVMIVMDRRLEYVAPIILLAGVPVTLFMMLQFPLLVQIFRSTYGSGIFERKMKPWR